MDGEGSKREMRTRSLDCGGALRIRYLRSGLIGRDVGGESAETGENGDEEEGEERRSGGGLQPGGEERLQVQGAWYVSQPGEPSEGAFGLGREENGGGDKSEGDGKALGHEQ